MKPGLGDGCCPDGAGVEPTPTDTPPGGVCGPPGGISGVLAAAAGGAPRGGVATREGVGDPGEAGPAAGAGGGLAAVGGGAPCGGEVCAGVAACAGPCSRLIKSSTICPSLEERARPSRSRVSPCVPGWDPVCGAACGGWPAGGDWASAPPAEPAMAAATRAGSARPKVRRIVIETLTFIQIRHRADNSLSVPTQKAAPAKMIASTRWRQSCRRIWWPSPPMKRPVQFFVERRDTITSAHRDTPHAQDLRTR